jgi:subtilisin family serine protease
MGKSKKACLVIILLCGLTSQVWAQKARYLVEFTDKNSSPFSLSAPLDYLSQRSIDRRLKQDIALSVRDLPVNPTYVQALQKIGANIWYTSRWMNAALVEADAAQLAQIRALTFVKQQNLAGWQPVSANRSGNQRTAPNNHQYSAGSDNSKNLRTNVLDYGFSTNQVSMIGADKMHQQGFTGQGMRVAIFDSGFRSANTLPAFRHVFTSNRLLATYDFVSKEESVFEDDEHGLRVFSAMAAYVPGQIIGTAYEAEYLLFRTEDASSEFRIEEINWLLAAEYADSAGVDVINSSLGYNYFSNPGMNYSRADMDGNTALVTRAADMAAGTGMLVVVSAGNEGDDPWQTVAAPADADSVLSVGAVDRDGLYAAFSSRGPTADGRIKPDVVAQGRGTVLSAASGNTVSSNGTSYSSPVLAGMATGFWQAYPQLTNMEVIDYLKKSATQSTKPDSLLGYGIPDFSKAAALVENDMRNAQEICRIWPNPAPDYSLTLWVNPRFKNEALTVQLFDVSGKLIDKQNIARARVENILTLKPELYARGTYIVRVTSPGIRWTGKVVKL